MAKKSAKHAAKAAEAQAAPSGGLVGKAKGFKEFFEESKVEIKKVTWPTRKETIATSIAVLVLVFVMSIYLSLVDLGLTKLVEFILS